MSPNQSTTRLLAFIEAESTREQISAALGEREEFQVADFSDAPEGWTQLVYQANPDIILVDYNLGDEKALEIIDELTLQFPEVAVVAILPDEDPLSAQRVTLAGARAFLLQPFTQANLLSTLRRVHEIRARNAQTRSPEATPAGISLRGRRTMAVFSPRGGAGCSTIAANLALALLEMTGQDVLLVDGKPFFGHLDVILNLRTHNTLADLIPHAATLDDGLLRDVVTEHVSGLKVLLGPNSLPVAQGIRPEDLYHVINALQRIYDYTVIDAGHTLNENTVTLLDSAARILLIAKPELASLRDIRQFLEISRTLGYPKEKIQVVLNQADVRGGVRIRDVESALQIKLFASIPEDSDNALRSLNRGVPMLLRYPNSPAIKAIRDMTKTLVEQMEAEVSEIQAEATLDSAQQDALITSSRLG